MPKDRYEAGDKNICNKKNRQEIHFYYRDISLLWDLTELPPERIAQQPQEVA